MKVATEKMVRGMGAALLARTSVNALSTSARIDAEQEFYLKSRGINSVQAQELLVFGFFEEVLSRLENEDLRAALRSLVRTKFIREKVAGN